MATSRVFCVSIVTAQAKHWRNTNTNLTWWKERVWGLSTPHSVNKLYQKLQLGPLFQSNEHFFLSVKIIIIIIIIMIFKYKLNKHTNKQTKRKLHSLFAQTHKSLRILPQRRQGSLFLPLLFSNAFFDFF